MYGEECLIMICFHNPNEENGYLSNWYMSDFVVDAIKFSSMEQYMMYYKAMVFKDIESMKKILSTNDVAKIKKLGRLVKNFDDVVWDSVKVGIVERGLMAKFIWNSDLMAKLLATGDEILAECAVRDKVWGIGLSMKDPKRFDTSLWRGINLLGICLMNVRACLRS